MRTCVWAHVRTRVRARVRACEGAHVRERLHVHVRAGARARVGVRVWARACGCTRVGALAGARKYA